MTASGNSSAILSGISVTAPTAEMSVLAAMGGFAPVPQVLAGILRDAPIETHNAARLARFVKATEEISQEISEPVSEAEVGVYPEVDLSEDGPMSDVKVLADLSYAKELVEYEGDVAEVVAVVEDAEGGVWARIELAEDGSWVDVHVDLWEGEFGTEAEMMLLHAWDTAEVNRMVRTLIAA